MTLTGKQEAFAKGIAAGKTITQSAIDAGYSERTAYSIGSENMKKPEITARIDQLQDDRAKLLQRRFVGEAERAFNELLQVLEDADTPPQTKTNTAKILLDYAGFKPTDKQEVKQSGELTVNNPFKDLTTEDLRKLARRK